MDILNNIWIALSTENVTLINWLSILLLLFFEMPLSLYLFKNLLDLKTNKSQDVIYVLTMTLSSSLTTSFVPSPFNVLLNYLVLFIVILLVFKLPIIKTAVAMLAPTVILSLLNMLFLNPFLNIMNITYEQGRSIPIYRITYLFLIYTLLALIVLLLKYRKITIFVIDDLSLKNKAILLLNLILGLFVIIIQIIIMAYYINNLPLTFTFLNFISLFAYFFISTYSLTRVMKLSVTKRELETAEAYNKSLSILHDNIRGFKHDFNNIVTTIGGFVKTEDMNGLKEYYKELENDCQRVNNIATLNPNIINNPGIFNLLSAKYHLADEKNIKINLEFFLDLNTLDVKTYEFSRILGILIDNAIDATSECEEKLINIKFRNENAKHRSVVIIENTYTNKDVNIEDIFAKGVSSKENHSGLGLWEVKQILKKNNNLNLYTTKTDNLFIQQLEIY